MENKFSIRRVCYPQITVSVLAIGCALLLTHCHQTKSVDTSAQVTESAVATVGAAVTATKGDSVAWNERVPVRTSFIETVKALLNPLPNAWGAACPTTASSACAASSNSLILTYGTTGCSISGGQAVWKGGTQLIATPTTYVATCGSGRFPSVDGTNVTSLGRVYTGKLLSSPTARTNAAGTYTVVIDMSNASSTTFADANSSSPTTGIAGWSYSIADSKGGYGRTYVSPTSHTAGITVRLVGYAGASPSGTAVFDHTLTTPTTDTPLNIAIAGQTQTVTGSLLVQNNLEKSTASVTFNSTGYDLSSGCCYPTSGSVTTSFTGGANDGLSESFAFSSSTCQSASLGQVSYTDVTGRVGTYALSHCF